MLMRADLHVHSRYSGPTDLPVLRHFGEESYSEPEAVYEPARRRGLLARRLHAASRGPVSSLRPPSRRGAALRSVESAS